VCISDTHGLTDNLKLPEGDVLIHAGDFTNVGSPDDVEKFNDYLKKQDFKYKSLLFNLLKSLILFFVKL